MNNELELLEFLKGYANKDNLTINFEELLQLFNDGKAPINNYLYSKLFLDKEKGTKFINKLGLYFPEQAKNNYSKNNNEYNNSITKDNSTTLIVPNDDFFDDIANSDEFKKIENVDLLTKLADYKFNDLYIERLQENKNDIAIYTQIINVNQPLVRKIASKYQNIVLGSILEYDDLISSGNLGLLKAIKKFNPSLGFQFSTYATWWIRQSISREIADRKHTIRLPVHMVESLNKLNRLLKQYGDYSIEKIEKICTSQMNITKDKFYEFLEIDRVFNKNLASLHTSIGEYNDTNLEEMINYDQNLYQRDVNTPEKIVTIMMFREEIEKYFNQFLTEKETDIVKKRIGWDDPQKTLEEIGHDYGLTRERIRQIESKSIEKIKCKLEEDEIHRYLEEI